MKQLTLNWNGVARQGDRVWLRLPNGRVTMVEGPEAASMLQLPCGHQIPVATYAVYAPPTDAPAGSPWVGAQGIHDLREKGDAHDH